MYLFRSFAKNIINHRINLPCKYLCTKGDSKVFETVFQFPTIKYISVLNRLKVYHLAGVSVGIPSSGALEIANIFPDQTFLVTSYIGK